MLVFMFCSCHLINARSYYAPKYPENKQSRIKLNLGLHVPPIIVKLPRFEMPQLVIGANLIKNPKAKPLVLNMPPPPSISFGEGYSSKSYGSSYGYAASSSQTHQTATPNEYNVDLKPFSSESYQMAQLPPPKTQVPPMQPSYYQQQPYQQQYQQQYQQPYQQPAQQYQAPATGFGIQLQSQAEYPMGYDNSRASITAPQPAPQYAPPQQQNYQPMPYPPQMMMPPPPPEMMAFPPPPPPAPFPGYQQQFYPQQPFPSESTTQQIELQPAPLEQPFYNPEPQENAPIPQKAPFNLMKTGESIRMQPNDHLYDSEQVYAAYDSINNDVVEDLSKEYNAAPRVAMTKYSKRH